jgi:hypothetical protein
MYGGTGGAYFGSGGGTSKCFGPDKAVTGGETGGGGVVIGGVVFGGPFMETRSPGGAGTDPKKGGGSSLPVMLTKANESPLLSPMSAIASFKE